MLCLSSITKILRLTPSRMSSLASVFPYNGLHMCDHLGDSGRDLEI